MNKPIFTNPLPPSPIPRALCITMKGLERWEKRSKHFLDHGVKAEPFFGVDGPRSGLRTSWTYEIDHPGSGYTIGPKIIGIALSHIMLWATLRHLPEDVWMVLEDDAQFDENWRARLEQALKDVPPDWDMLFHGSCNCFDKEKTGVKGEVYAVKWPQCTHAYLVRRKALDTLLETNIRIWAPLDCALAFESFPKLKVYTILPRLVAQEGTEIYP